MIYESHYWKKDLLRSAKSLESRVAQKRWHQATFASVERTVMIGFYSLRKLIEASKIDDKIINLSVPLTSYPATNKLVNRMNWTDWWELYDLNQPTSSNLKLVLLCHQFIHSYVFSCEFSEDKKFVGVLVSSDRERNRVLYSVAISEVVRIFETAGRNYPTDMRMKFNAGKSDYDITSVTK